MSDWMDAEAHADRALEMFERGRWAEAEAELRKALSLNPDQAEWHYNLGLTLEQAGRDSDALECYERAIALLPEQPDPLLAAGVVANRLGQFPRAIKWLDKALALDATFEEAYAHKMESHIRSGHHEEAETTFYMAQQALHEPSAPCLAVMAESLIERRQWERAEWCLREAMRVQPNMPRLRSRLASVFAATGKPQRAIQLFLRELRDDPGHIDTLLEFGNLLQDLGRHPEAAEKYRRVLELEPANADAHFKLGQIALAAHRYEQATLEFELVLKLDGNYPGVRAAIGVSLLRRHHLADARRHLLEEFALVKAAVTESLQSHSGEDEASDAGAPSPGMKSLPYSPRQLVEFADLLLEVNEPRHAAEVLQVALSGGEDVEALRQLALARFRSGDHRGGAAASRRVLRLDPTCIRSIHNLALAALQQNQLVLASGWVRKGMRINRHDDGLRRLRMRLWMAQAKHLARTFPKIAAQAAERHARRFAILARGQIRAWSQRASG